MQKKRHGELRRSQLITTFGPGSLIDLPRDSGIVGGLEHWPRTSDLEAIDEPRLAAKVAALTEVERPGLYAPPMDRGEPGQKPLGVGVLRFPRTFLGSEEEVTAQGVRRGAKGRRMVQDSALQRGRFDGKPAVPIRFVRTCPRGHVDDIDWHGFVHRGAGTCLRTTRLWLVERGTSGNLGDLYVLCQCGAQRSMGEAQMQEMHPLGICSGRRPWIGPDAGEDCEHHSRLLIRTASNAYFSQVVSVLSLPDSRSAVDAAVGLHWKQLQTVEEAADLRVLMKQAEIAADLQGFTSAEVLTAIERRKRGPGSERPIKEVEVEALLSGPEGYDDDVPVDPNFHVRRLPEAVVRDSGCPPEVAQVVQVHRLRETQALVGFSRLEPVLPDIHGEYAADVARAPLAREASWFPAVENRGEGLFVQLEPGAVEGWMERAGVRRRIQALREGHERHYGERRVPRVPEFPDGPYLLLHTLSHLLIQSVSLRCGYPASSIRERIYVHGPSRRYGILLFTASPDAEGTLGGLVQQARRLGEHLAFARRAAALCSNDPICAGHDPLDPHQHRWLHGAACHGCLLISETSCEMRNEYLDRALLVPVMGLEDAAFFQALD